MWPAIDGTKPASMSDTTETPARILPGGAVDEWLGGEADWNFSTGWEDASWAVDGGSKPTRTSAEVIRWPAPPPPPPLAAPMRTPPRGLRVEVMETRGVLGVPRDGMLFVDYDRDWSAVAEELEIDGPQDGEGGLVSPAFYQLPSLASAAASSAPRRQRLPWE